MCPKDQYAIFSLSVTVMIEFIQGHLLCNFFFFFLAWVERYMAHIGKNIKYLVFLVLAASHQPQRCLSTKAHETLQRNADKRKWPHITSSIIYSFVNTHCTLLGCVPKSFTVFMSSCQFLFFFFNSLNLLCNIVNNIMSFIIYI